ncbi:X-Pro aminopeptidase [Suhomyces tanzawaensis NRRL Y-17324]|uniref:Xaa-Pro aminopeptidase n=1 Tax=Suhomyces tanzawaensis NRRL Y-17324 TaxID=984487 RepID=A0A1E4SJJ2_9ASCO|nr:X-Pro aminopeptidase [Suhomyces tanzawaensis NRRL Y-17324]ODV79660.1 X-Pro aminopeptidase [Suhomyces tanzawaensis NRRL Y-17324]
MSRVSRGQCANCTCSPGLLSRSNRRSSLFAQKINIKRTNSGVGGSRSGSRKASVFTIDASLLCVPETKEINTSKRLEALRLQMAEYNLGVYIIPSEDQHQSEYVSAIDQRRSFISGFLGSAGIAIVTRDLTCMNDVPEGLAALSTDGRYFNQANNELDFNWLLLKQRSTNQPTWEEWTVNQAIQLSLDSGSKVNIGVDPKLISPGVFQHFSTLIASSLSKNEANKKAEVEFVAINDNLVDKIWETFETVPSVKREKVFKLDEKFSGESTADKIERVKKFAFKNYIDGLVVTALDEIAWLLNLRGQDIEYNPVFFSHLIITKENGTKLFINRDGLDSDVLEYLKANNISVEPYESFYSSLFSISKDFNLTNKQFLIPSNTNWEVLRNLKCSYTEVLSPIEELKSIKNAVEINGAKSAHLKDGRALIKFFAWLEQQLVDNQELIDECAADDKLTEFRKEEENFKGLSFATISATEANGAIVHYSPTRGACSTINPNKMYLNDSGSQFLEGTTDTTRTVHFGQPTYAESKNYTLVLKGNIALSTLKFPEATSGNLIDSIARQYLWKFGLDYGHGTSHGVGSFLNVHEGPIGIGPRPNAANHLKVGQILSNEPGYYEEGEYGIRIENVMVIKDSGLIYGGKHFFEFETITRVPLCKRLINVDMLDEEEIAWINGYHNTIWRELNESFDPKSYVYRWFRRETSPLVKKR